MVEGEKKGSSLLPCNCLLYHHSLSMHRHSSSPPRSRQRPPPPRNTRLSRLPSSQLVRSGGVLATKAVTWRRGLCVLVQYSPRGAQKDINFSAPSLVCLLPPTPRNGSNDSKNSVCCSDLFIMGSRWNVLHIRTRHAEGRLLFFLFETKVRMSYSNA